MSIISGLSCTQSTGDTTATVANIFQHEQNATRLEVDVFHNPAVYLRESNKYSCPHKSQPLGKNKAVWATGRRWTFSLRSHKPAGILIPWKSDIFNTLSMNFAQPKILCSIQNQEVCIRFSLIKFSYYAKKTNLDLSAADKWHYPTHVTMFPPHPLNSPIS